VPVELPGSMPDDLPHPDNLDLYAPPPKPRPASMDDVRHSEVPTQKLPAIDVLKTAFASEAAQSVATISQELPHHPVHLRRSLDQVRPHSSSAQQRARAFLEQSRPRVNSDQVPPAPSGAPRPRASFDQARTLPTLNEKPLERFDSNASVSLSEAATVPLPTRRQKPKAVNVRRIPATRSSDPARLPSFSGHTSLMDDLSSYLSDSPTSVTNSTPSTSAASSPVLTQSPTSYVALVEGCGHATVLPATGHQPAELSAASSPRSSRSYPIFSSPLVSSAFTAADVDKTIGSVETRETVQSTQPSENKLESEAKVSHAASTAQASLVRHGTMHSPPSRSRTGGYGQDAVAATQMNSENYARVVAAATRENSVIVYPEKEVTKAVEPYEAKSVARGTGRPSTSTPLTDKQQIHHDISVNSSAISALTTEALPSVSMVAAATPAPAVSSQPMTAQARRRAAHARRMQLAFGAEQDKATDARAAQ
jgi:hypothetical protein